MQQVSSDFLPALAGSHTRVCNVDAYRNGQLVARGLPVSSGSLTMTAGQSVRSQLSMSITDPDGLFTPGPTSPLSPFGSELRVRAGMLRGTVLEALDLGWFGIQDAETAETWKPYERPAEPGVNYWVSRGATTSITAADRAQKVLDARFVTRQQPAKATVLAEIGWLLRGIVPWAPPNVADKSIPSGITYEDDRLDAVKQLGAVLNLAPVMLPSGSMTLRDPAWHPWSDWSIPQGPGGVLVSMQRKVSRVDMHNAVVARGTAPDGRPLQAVAYEATEILRWGGPFGQVPLFYESPLLTTQYQVNQAAATRMATERANRFQQIDISCVCNYALELGDMATIPAPKGDLTGQVVGMTWPLGPGEDKMSITLSVDPFVLASVS